MKLDILVEIFDLLRLWRQLSVREHYPVSAEIIIAWSLLEISANLELETSRCYIWKLLVGLHTAVSADNILIDELSVPRKYRLVGKIPYKSALILLVIVLQLRVFFHAAAGISHCMHILTAYVRLLRLRVEIFPYLGRLRIHSALHVRYIGVAPVMHAALIVHQSLRISLVEKSAHGQNVLARMRLISAGPDEHARMVFVPLKHRHGSVKHCALPHRIASRRNVRLLISGINTPRSVCLKVSLVYQIYSELIAQLIPVALVWIVAGSHRVDIEALYNSDILKHLFFLERPSVHTGELMAVHTLKDDSLSIDTHYSVLHLKTSETDALRNILDKLAVLIVHGYVE